MYSKLTQPTFLMFSSDRFMMLNRQTGDGETLPEGAAGYELAHSLSKRDDKSLSISTNAREQIELYLNNGIELES